MSQKLPKATLAKRARILLLDKHPVCCEGLESIIRRDEHLLVCGHASDPASALSAVSKLKPDLVIADIDLTGKSGIELIRDLHAVQPGLPVLLVSLHDENVYAEWVLRAGGRGYTSKESSPERILEAINTVLAGKVYVSERISASLLRSLAVPNTATSSSPIPKLTEREFEVFRLIGQGLDGHEIANALHVSIKTTDTHRGRIREKLGFKTVAALAHYATLWMAGMGQEQTCW